MSFNSSHVVNNRDGNPLSQPTTKSKARGIGTQYNQPLVSAESSLKPTLSVFITGTPAHPIVDFPNLDNVSSIGLSQVVITGLPTLTSPIVMAIHFKGSSGEFSLPATGYHNLKNIPKGCIFLLYDGTGIAQLVFGGEPVILCQKRTPVDIKTLELEFINTENNATLSYDKFHLWLFCLPINWQ
jgi:hypothetical protein